MGREIRWSVFKEDGNHKRVLTEWNQEINTQTGLAGLSWPEHWMGTAENIKCDG